MKYLLEQYCVSLTNSVIYIKISVLVLFISFSLRLNAQKISTQVFNGWGSSIYLNRETFDGSVGESGVTTLKAGGYIITQGFLQPIDLKLPCGEIQLKAFPNPVVSEMRIYAEGCDVKISAVKAYDLFGKLVYEGEPLENNVDFSSVGEGDYMVRALDEEEKVNGVIKVVKTTI